ncbi:ABC transporter [uncultured Microbacterium sp.]|uniref:ABC transporter n=1 Tax=uncultured Microbacterium sp. TaxID=191216 RepID=A0A1Y5P7U9_9MICO|nr:ABC transporter [uncultured Microbacterium sp.]SBS73399.1 ABC transporter [uncultured Microbacterium sp.]
MSDPKYGEPVDDSTPARDDRSVDDVVGSANAGLAEAEAAKRDAVTPDEQAAAARSEEAARDDVATDGVRDDRPAGAAYDDRSGAAYDDRATAASTGAAASTGSLRDRSYADDRSADDDGLDYLRTGPAATGAPATGAPTDDRYAAPAAEAPTEAYRPAASEPVAPVVAPAPQPIFVQAPEAPRARGNRGAAGAIGLLAAVAFAVLYLAAALGFGAIEGDVTLDNVGEEALAALTTWWFWVPVVVFFLGFWILGAVINRGRWGLWVIFGLIVGAVAYVGHLLGQLFQAPFWTLTASQGAEVVNEQLLAPLAIAAFVFGRELTIWFGAWVAARGKRVTELNYEAQREYERTLEAGPQLHRA